MGLFTPVKKHANTFRYIPRYYDPEKERREQRRKELHGTCAEQEGSEYVPGQYIRTQREARRLSHRERRSPIFGGATLLLMFLAVLLVAAYMLYPQLAKMFATMRAPQTTQEQLEVETFNPYTPITIVPDDYKEE